MDLTKLRTFLTARAINTIASPDEFMKQVNSVVPLTDITEAIGMIEDGSFDDWLEKMEAHNPRFLKAFSAYPQS